MGEGEVSQYREEIFVATGTPLIISDFQSFVIPDSKAILAEL